MSDFWENLWNGGNSDDDTTSSNGANGVDDYEVDPQKIRSMGLRRAGKDAYGNRIWKDKAGHQYTAAQLAKKGNGSSKNTNTPVNMPWSNEWQKYAQGGYTYTPQQTGAPDTNAYTPPAVNFPTPKTAVYMPVLKSWVDVTNPYTAVNESNKAAWQSKNSLPQEVNTTLKTIFISSHSGKFLEEKLDFIEPNPEKITFKKENISIRAIDDNDWRDLKKYNAPANEVIKTEVGTIGYALQSVQVKADFTKLKEDLRIIMIEDRLKTKEKNLILAFDKKNNELTTLVQDFSENKSGECFYQLQNDAYEDNSGKKDKFIVSKANNMLIAIGTIHTHPLLPIEIKGRRNAPGMSPEDIESTKKFVMVDYALQIYSKDPINISRAFPDGTQEKNFQTYDNILNDSFNIFLDALKIYFKWHK